MTEFVRKHSKAGPERGPLLFFKAKELCLAELLQEFSKKYAGANALREKNAYAVYTRDPL